MAFTVFCASELDWCRATTAAGGPFPVPCLSDAMRQSRSNIWRYPRPRL